MIALQLLILAVLLIGAFYASRFLFWFIFMKDAPVYDEQENYYIHYGKNK